MNWNKNEHKSSLAFGTPDFYSWFINTVGNRPIKWSEWYYLEPIRIVKYIEGEEYFKDQDGYAWYIHNGFVSRPDSLGFWEFADELE